MTLVVSPSPIIMQAQAQPSASSSVAPILAPQVAAQMREKLVEKLAVAVLADLQEVTRKDIDGNDEVFKVTKEFPKGAHGIRQTRPSTGESVVIIVNPPAVLKANCRADLEGDLKKLTTQQTNCYKATLVRCVTKLTSCEESINLAVVLGIYEPEIQKNVDFTKSKLLCSKAITVTSRMSAKVLTLF